MLANPNLLMSMLSGALDQSYVYSASKGSGGGYIQSVRRYTMPYNPNTADQQAVRHGFATSSLFFKNAADKTIGAVSFTRAAFLAEIDANVTALAYRGIPSVGTSAGRQTWIMAAMLQCADASDYALWDVLPQDCTTAPQLQGILNDIAAAFALIQNRMQRERIGYVS
jgi:hypothetical protein